MLRVGFIAPISPITDHIIHANHNQENWLVNWAGQRQFASLIAAHESALFDQQESQAFLEHSGNCPANDIHLPPPNRNGKKLNCCWR
jgi:hypothetical protein